MRTELFSVHLGFRLLAILALSPIISSCGTDESLPSSPIADILGVSVSPDGTDVDAPDLASEFDAIRSCMKAEGFEWHPVSLEANFGSVGVDLSKEWASEYGLGISTQILVIDSMPPGLMGRAAVAADKADSADANQTYVEGLSSAEKEAYDRALYGSVDLEKVALAEEENGQEAALEYIENAADLGCVGVANEDNVERRRLQSLRAELGAELEEMEHRIEADPRLISLEQDIKKCMKGQGWEYLGTRDIGAGFHQEASELLSLLDTDGDNRLDEGLSNSPDLARLAELQSREIDYTLSLFACEGDRKTVEDRRRTLRQEYEELFVDDFRSILEAIASVD